MNKCDILYIIKLFINIRLDLINNIIIIAFSLNLIWYNLEIL